jgi:hypothetical protein
MGEGSYGEMYCAWDPTLEREVALKLLKIPPALSNSVKSLDEARRLARIRHPNVVVVHGAAIHDGRMGMWMELIRGRSLEQWLEEQGRLGAHEAARIGVDLARALVAVHAAGIIHRDVKTQNVMREEGGRILLMDFGAGIESVGAAPAATTGTPYYMAPELLRGEPATRSSDLYALGIVQYRLVSGRFPVEGGSWDELRDRHARGETLLLRDARPDLPEGFLAIVERALAADPARRFASAGEMEQVLARFSGTTAATDITARRALRPAWIAAAIIGAGALLLAALQGRHGDDKAAGPKGAVAIQGGTAVTPYTISATFHRVAAHSDLRAPLGPGDRLALGDRLTLEFRASTALNVYVLDEDEAGHTFVLFPLPELQPQNPLPAGGPHVLPGTSAGNALSWTVDTAGGREHLLVVASPERLVDLERELARVARPGQTAVLLDAAARMQLRGLGRLSTSPVARPATPPGPLFERVERLAAGSERIAGVWIRRLDLENPTP